MCGCESKAEEEPDPKYQQPESIRSPASGTSQPHRKQGGSASDLRVLLWSDQDKAPTSPFSKWPATCQQSLETEATHRHQPEAHPSESKRWAARGAGGGGGVLGREAVLAETFL